ncbi:hypothetical protein ATANTOWER_031728 [Ataeniobius toweri]|uniref:Uncharacterized protein n=1 Tax=Ataeniobius toweri TaxID=208326 RepID=A0ABU7BF03_9TELE|nr:hypothetical protein [Ataeniobius toweri]
MGEQRAREQCVLAGRLEEMGKRQGIAKLSAACLPEGSGVGMFSWPWQHPAAKEGHIQMPSHEASTLLKNALCTTPHVTPSPLLLHTQMERQQGFLFKHAASDWSEEDTESNLLP